MGRRPRLDHRGAVHHVINRGVDRQRVFFADSDRVEFGERLAEIHERFAAETLAYCLLDNHYHLIIRTPNGDLSTAMHHLGLVYTRHTNDRVGRDGPLFRGRFWSNPVETDTYLLRAVRYVHRNALDVAGVERADSYRWSSYRTYVGARRRPRFVNTDVVMSLFNDSVDAFRRAMDDPTVHRDLRTVGEVIAQLRLEIALADVQADWADGEAAADAARSRGMERTVLTLIADHIADGRLRSELVERLDHPTPDARRVAFARARKRACDPLVARLVANVLEAIAPPLAA